jgi:hypothetical protein
VERNGDRRDGQDSRALSLHADAVALVFCHRRACRRKSGLPDLRI